MYLTWAEYVGQGHVGHGRVVQTPTLHSSFILQKPVSREFHFSWGIQFFSSGGNVCFSSELHGFFVVFPHIWIHQIHVSQLFPSSLIYLSLRLFAVHFNRTF